MMEYVFGECGYAFERRKCPSTAKLWNEMEETHRYEVRMGKVNRLKVMAFKYFHCMG